MKTALRARGEDTSDTTRLRLALRRAGTAGMTQTEVHALFSRNKTAEDVSDLLRSVDAQASVEKTGGRPRIRWSVT